MAELSIASIEVLLPKISAEQRTARRQQILEAAWICFDRAGLHGATMADIIRVSELSSGAVYLYFKSKEEIILAAVTTSLGSFASLTAPLLVPETGLGPAELIGELTEVIERFTQRDRYNLRTIAIHGWSEAQSNEALKAAIANPYRNLRDRLAKIVRRWQAAGLIESQADPEDVAKSIMSLLLGFLVQSAILQDVKVEEHTRGIAALIEYVPKPTSPAPAIRT